MTDAPHHPGETVFRLRQRPPGVALEGVTETGWGYVVASAAPVSKNAAAFERAAGLAGLVAFALAGTHWLVPPLQAALGLPAQIALSAALAVLGLALCWLPDRGLLDEVMVDVEARMLRCTLTNARGAIRIWREIAFDEVGSVFVRRSKTPGIPSKLFLRVGVEGDDLIEVTRGPAAALAGLQARMARDLHGSCLRKVAPGRGPRAAPGRRRVAERAA